jgi:hypothetical protein
MGWLLQRLDNRGLFQPRALMRNPVGIYDGLSLQRFDTRGLFQPRAMMRNPVGIHDGLSLQRHDTRGCANPGLECGIPLGFMMVCHCNCLIPGVVPTPGFDAEFLWDS